MSKKKMEFYESISVPHGTIQRISDDFGVCTDTVRNALRGTSRTFAAYLIQRAALLYYGGKQ